MEDNDNSFVSATESSAAKTVTMVADTDATIDNPTASSEKDPLNSEELNKAAYEFSQLIPQIRAFSKNMNRNGVARVLTALMEFPLGDKYPKFKDKTENQLFMMCLHAQGNKQIMTEAVFGQNKNLIKEIQQEAVDGVVDEVLSQKQKEVSNELEKTGDATQG